MAIWPVGALPTTEYLARTAAMELVNTESRAGE